MMKYTQRINTYSYPHQRPASRDLAGMMVAADGDLICEQLGHVPQKNKVLTSDLSHFCRTRWGVVGGWMPQAQPTTPGLLLLNPGSANE